MGWVKYRMVGVDNYVDLLTDPDIWTAMQTTAHFVFWSILFEVLIGFGLALLINRKFRGYSLWTTVILLPMMLSPAVVGNFWTFLFQPQIGLFNYIVGWIGGIDPGSFQMIGDVRLAPWTIVLVDTWMWTPYIMPAGNRRAKDIGKVRRGAQDDAGRAGTFARPVARDGGSDLVARGTRASSRGRIGNNPHVRMNAATSGSSRNCARSVSVGCCGRSRSAFTTQRKPSASSWVARN